MDSDQLNAWRETYAREWAARFRLRIAQTAGGSGEMTRSPGEFFPDIQPILGPRALGLSVYAGKYSGNLRSLLVRNDAALARLSVPWKASATPYVGWDGSRVLLEMPWPDALADKDIRSATLLRGQTFRRVRQGTSWLVGVTQRYEPLCLSLNPAEGSPHYLLSGETQSGKTFALRSLLMQLSFQGHNQFVLICASRKDSLGIMEGMPGLVFPIAKTLEDARIAMKWVADQIGPRLRCGPVGPGGIPGRLIMAVDEVQALKDDPVCTELLHVTTSQGAEAGVHVIGATQRPVVAELGAVGGTVKGNMSGRIALRTPDVQGSTIALGVSGEESRLSSLKGQGDAVVNNPHIEPTRVQISYFTIEEIVRYLGKGSRPRFHNFEDSGVVIETERPANRLSFSAEQEAIALIMRARRIRTGRGQGYGRTRLRKALATIGQPVSDHGANVLMERTQRIYDILRKNDELEWE